MIVGIGTDLVEVRRIRNAHGRRGDRFLERVFTPQERADCGSGALRYERYSARFAAKEALLKALGTGLSRGIRWHDVAVARTPDGRPDLVLGGAALAIARSMGVSRPLLSLSHAGGYAIAFVLLDTRTGPPAADEPAP
jgi:holo-[acyl-carrier protein] synthase